MQSRKVLTLILVIAAVLAVLGSLWFAAQARRELAAANQALATSERLVALAEARARKAEAAALAAKPAVAVRAESSRPDPPEAFEPPQAWKEVRRSPEYLRIIGEEFRAGMIENYATIFRKLELSPEALRRLQDLMIERNQVGWEIMSAEDDLTEEGLTPAQRNVLIEDQQAAIDQEIAAFLGPGKWEVFQEYNRTLDSRHEVKTMAQHLDIAQMAITDGQVDELTSALAAAQSKLRTAYEGLAPSAVPIEARRAADAEFLVSIKDALDAEQLAILTEYFEQKRTLEEDKRRMGEKLHRLTIESHPPTDPN